MEDRAADVAHRATNTLGGRATTLQQEVMGNVGVVVHPQADRQHHNGRCEGVEGKPQDGINADSFNSQHGSEAR